MSTPDLLPRKPTNGLAIAAFIVVFFSTVVGLILGLVALGQIDRNDEGGRGLASAAVIIGVFGTLAALVIVAVVWANLVTAANQ